MNDKCIKCGRRTIDLLTKDWTCPKDMKPEVGFTCFDYAKTPCFKNKETNIEAKYDGGKIRPTLVPTQIIKDIAEVREFGVKKYGDNDCWKTVEMGRYMNALYRHLIEAVNDINSIDEESGLPHYKHMAANMAFICEMMEGLKNGMPKS